ncbi:MAG: DegT/DnrJ/EryC1/StrS family aminotransferase [Candidatus Marinimicrobia bacterium]|nr:DegT/DnrJ/EryC1/StrS family aminotransferase [Candidatus Neomarinimicrobiota bacterium]
MKFCDLHRQYIEYKKEIDAAIAGVIDKTAFINGPDIAELENELADFSGANSAIACSSGSDAISLALMALDVQPGDEVLCPAFTFIATGTMISVVGAKPVFVDVDPVTFNLDPDKIEEKITAKTKGIIVVSLYGQCADFDRINDIAKKHDLWVLEDGAQSFGAEYKGKRSCALTNIATTSFFPAKPLGCYGDGGAIFTADAEIAEKIRMIRNHGQEKRYHHKMIGVNGRMDTLQAAIIRVKLKYFPNEIKERNRVADTYTEELKDCVNTPLVLKNNLSVWAQYTIQVENRDKLRETLAKDDIPTAVHYPMPLPKQEAFKYLEQGIDFPVSNRLSETVISLPMHPFLSNEEIGFVSQKIKDAING